MARVNVNFNGREITGPFWGLNQGLMKDLVGKKKCIYKLHGWTLGSRCVSRVIRQDGQSFKCHKECFRAHVVEESELYSLCWGRCI